MGDLLVVGVITRARPQMFGRLLDSFAKMKLPTDVEVEFVFAENADVLSVEHHVRELRKTTGCRCRLLAEPRIGIPFARNAVLDCAIGLNAQYLVFVDDDEWVPEDWLVQIYSSFVSSGNDLATGPILPRYTGSEPLNWLQQRLLEGVVGWYARSRNKNRNNLARGEAHRIGAATNNWICDLNFVRRTGLRFCEDIGLGGGSDTAFWRDLQKLGGSSTWIDDAPLYDTVPISRLTLVYQFKRGRDQAAAEWRRRERGGGIYMLLRSLPFIISNLFEGILRSILGLIASGPHLTFGLRRLGAAVGRASAVCGRYDAHYEKPHGN